MELERICDSEQCATIILETSNTSWDGIGTDVVWNWEGFFGEFRSGLYGI